MTYKSAQTVQRLRLKKLQGQVDPILADILTLIVRGKYSPAIRKQIEANLSSLQGFLKNQKRKVL